MLTSLFKYIPQVYLNYTLKSTVGWSIINVLLDITGGILSLFQLFLDAIRLNVDCWWNAVFAPNNLVKFGLGLASLLFDSLFLMQHYVWFRRDDGGGYDRIYN